MCWYKVLTTPPINLFSIIPHRGNVGKHPQYVVTYSQVLDRFELAVLHQKRRISSYCRELTSLIVLPASIPVDSHVDSRPASFNEFLERMVSILKYDVRWSWEEHS